MFASLADLRLGHAKLCILRFRVLVLKMANSSKSNFLYHFITLALKFANLHFSGYIIKWYKKLILEELAIFNTDPLNLKIHSLAWPKRKSAKLANN